MGMPVWSLNKPIRVVATLLAVTGIAYSRKFKDESEGMVELPDPNQPEFAIGGRK